MFKRRPRLSVKTITMFTCLVFVVLFIFIMNSENNKITNRERLKTNPDQSSLKVIVGHYIGKTGQTNLTPEELNANNFNPVPGAGEDGRPVQLSSRDFVRSKELYRLHSFNIIASDMIPLDRSLPDMRNRVCQEREIPLEGLPTASVIIVFHNEAWSTLMRTITSVVNRTPKELLKEIILVDDSSTRTYLGKDLEKTVAKMNVVKILRSSERAGLVHARLMGAKAATGDVLVFLDAHCEVTDVWMEPLLERAGGDDVFVCPHIDRISEDTFSYVRTSEAHWGAFNRRLHFRWLSGNTLRMTEQRSDASKPYPTPAMAGGLFAVRRSLFWHMGSYDEGMKVWGGENLELSWRAWQCGARVEIHPCSRVGHVFRSKSPYTFPGGVGNVLHTNLARAAMVWMDEWADFIYKFNPEIAAIRDKQLIRDRFELRKKLNCKNFRWYLENVWPDHFYPTDDRWFGRIKNKLGACLSTAGVKSNDEAIGVRCLSDLELEGLLVMTEDGQIMADDGKCLQKVERRAMWKGCNGDLTQKWLQKGPRIKMKNFCLGLSRDFVNSSIGLGAPLEMRNCEDRSEQIWFFERVPWR